MIGMLRLLSSGRDFWVEAEYLFNFFDKKDFQYARNKLIEDIGNRRYYLSWYQKETIELINHFSAKWQQTAVPDIATYYYDILGEIERHSKPQYLGVFDSRVDRELTIEECDKERKKFEKLNGVKYKFGKAVSHDRYNGYFYFELIEE